MEESDCESSVKKVRITCDSRIPTFPLEELQGMQGDLKELSIDNFKKLKNSIDEEGFFAPFLLWKSESFGTQIIDGHQRLRVLTEMKQRGYEVPPLPGILVEAKCQEEAKRKLLRTVSQFGQVTKDGLYEFLEGARIDPAMLATDFRIPEVNVPYFMDEYYTDLSRLPENVMPMPGAAPIDQNAEQERLENEFQTREQEESENLAAINRLAGRIPVSKKGELWKLGNHRVLCGSSLDSADFQRLTIDNGAIARAELCFTSPPYADQREYEGGKELSVEALARFISTAAHGVVYFAVNLGYSRKDGEVNAYWQTYIDHAKASGLKLLSWNVWDKMQAGSVGNQTAMFPIEHEWIFVFGEKPKDLNKTEDCKWAGIEKTTAVRNPDGSLSPTKYVDIAMHKAQGTVMRHFPEKARNHGCDHPAMFPVGFPEKYILAMTHENDFVYEPFAGSGSTLIACERTKRKCLAMELEPLYVDMILERWARLTGLDPIREDGKSWAELLAETQEKSQKSEENQTVSI